MRLPELQQAFVRTLLDGAALPSSVFAPASTPATAALAVHRDTVLGGLTRALALTFPTVLALIGARAFERAAIAFAVARPPRRARLDEYGEGFPDFLDEHPQDGPACLGDVARLDFAVDRAAAAPRLSRMLPIDAAVAMAVPVSLGVLTLAHPADLIRDAVEAGQGELPAATTGQPRRLAVWRSHAGASVLPLTGPAARFLEAMLHGAAAEAAVAAAGADPEAALLAIQAEVFAAPFTVITPILQEEDLA
jgi:hypothetical protein